MDTFTSVDDSVLIQTISSARQRLVFIAPGLRPPVADALMASALFRNWPSNCKRMARKDTPN